jgi:hypothetical protein
MLGILLDETYFAAPSDVAVQDVAEVCAKQVESEAVATELTRCGFELLLFTLHAQRLQ